MSTFRKSLLTLTAAAALSGVLAAPSSAIVGGSDAGADEFPAIAEITFGKSFLCTGTLIAPNYVLTAGHCGSITGAAVASPVTWPAPLIDVRIGGNKAGQGKLYPVSSVTGHPNYLATQGYDISLLKLSTDATQTPVKVAGTADRALWNAGVNQTIVGWGTTSEGGDTPDTLQKATVPVTTDATCGSAYSEFDVKTMLCAGFPQGGVDTCQGDSGGPLFGGSGTGLRVDGSTSFGEGCARPGKPGVYARVGDDTLREWIRSKVPNGVG
jgi:secreted trypsin-like serine protease